MASKVFLDANIVLDFILKREYYPVSKNIIELILQGEVHGYITPSIVHILGYWSTKSYGQPKAKELLLTLLADIRVIDTNHEIVLLALNSRIRDIEDGLQYYTAISHKLDYFISRDKALAKDAIPNLPVIPPEEFLAIYQDN